MKKIIFFALLIGGIFACGGEAEEKLSTLDLLSYGLPITIHAPDSATVKKNNSDILKDVTITQGNNFSIQIFASQITSNSLVDLKATQLEEVKNNRYFSKIITDEENGFIFENAMDSTTIYYGFRHVHYQADFEYIFQQGLSDIFKNQADVEKMYEAVKQGGK